MAVAAIVYLLCAATALVCTLLLLRGWRQSRVPLLFWSGLCFAALTLENIFLFVDIIVLPNVDLWWWRAAFSLVAVALLLFGLVSKKQ